MTVSWLPCAQFVPRPDELAGDEFGIAGHEVIGVEPGGDDAVVLTAIAQPHAEQVRVDGQLSLPQPQPTGDGDGVLVGAVAGEDAGGDFIGVPYLAPARPVLRVAIRTRAPVTVAWTIPTEIALALPAGDGDPLMLTTGQHLQAVVEHDPPGPFR